MLGSRNRPEFEALVRDHYGAVYRFLVRRVGEDRAGDLAQEVFVSAQKSWNRFRGDSSAKTWLLGIAANHCRHAIRASMNEREKQSEFEIEIAGTSPEGALLDRETVRWAVGQLSDDHREVVLLHELDGLTYEDAAAVLGVPVGTVKSRLHHAFVHLRRLLLQPDQPVEARP